MPERTTVNLVLSFSFPKYDMIYVYISFTMLLQETVELEVQRDELTERAPEIPTGGFRAVAGSKHLIIP